MPGALCIYGQAAAETLLLPDACIYNMRGEERVAAYGVVVIFSCNGYLRWCGVCSGRRLHFGFKVCHQARCDAWGA